MSSEQATKHVVIGTAGHVDHGKTTLVRALTGVDTDRLPEEKRREMTIDLGFARFVLPGGQEASIIDVPGHERLVGNMLAGATGIDLVLLVVAADQGVMPQTVEHLDILDLLGLDTGVVALTRADLVDAELLALVDEEVAALLAGTRLAGAPRIAVSSRTGQGLDQLIAACQAAFDRAPAKPAAGPARLPVDRVFVAPGFGTVVTGTLVSGRVEVDDRLELLPAGRQARVRGLEVHGRRLTRARAGERTAINLAGLSHEHVARGHVLAQPGAFAPTTVFEGQLRYLGRSGKPLLNRQRLHLHTGTSTAVGRVMLLEGPELAPGDTGMIQFHLETPLVLGPRDRFIVRSFSPVRTVGGGIVIDPAAAARRRRPAGAAAAAAVGRLRQLQREEPEEAAWGLVQQLESSALLVPRPDLLRRLEAGLSLEPAAAVALLERMEGSGRLMSLAGGTRLVAVASWERLVERVTGYLRAYHQRWPLRLGAAREEVRLGPLEAIAPRHAQAVLEAMVGQGHVALVRERLTMPGWAPAPAGPWAELADRVLGALAAGGSSPPGLADLAAQLGDPQPADRTKAAGTRFGQVLEHLTDSGEVVLVGPDLGFAREPLAALVEVLRAWLAEHGSVSVGDFRQAAGTTRKYAVPLLEYFDQQGWTVRRGDRREAGPSLGGGSGLRGGGDGAGDNAQDGKGNGRAGPARP